MTAVGELELPAFDYLDPTLGGPRFHDTMRELATQSWLASMPLGFVALEREAGEFFLRSRAFTFPGMKIAEIFGIDDGPLWEEIRRNILHINGDDHRRLRGLVNPAFTPARGRDAGGRRCAATLADLFERHRARCDAVDALCKPYPSRVIATVMGAPLRRRRPPVGLVELIQRQFGMKVLEERAADRAGGRPSSTTGRARAARPPPRRSRRRPDLDADRAPLRGRAARRRRAVNLVLNVLVGGVDTTQSQLAHALRLFAEHPDQWEQLARASPSSRRSAVDEVLRYEPITPFTARIALEDVTYRDVTFPEGTVVLVCAHTGNRDPATYESPDALRHHRRARLAQAADVRRRPALLPRREPRPRRAAGGARVPRAPASPTSRSTASREFGSIDGIYGLDALPIRWSPAATG